FCIGSPGRIELQIRVPKDNNNTLHFWYRCELNESCHDNSSLLAEAVQLFNADGSFNVLTIDGQDAMAWVTQGPITDRTKENLGPSDKGIILYRELLAQQIGLVESGKCPMGVSFEGNSRLIPTVRRKETRLVNMPL
ncbi:MAG TPA: hypothetical protein VN843_12720, partial [Anaerolineales bacterium]|nr:hypothetical protein [Anaerolineales bacterium]